MLVSETFYKLISNSVSCI